MKQASICGRGPIERYVAEAVWNMNKSLPQTYTVRIAFDEQ